jgi:hypothetical protein
MVLYQVKEYQGTGLGCLGFSSGCERGRKARGRRAVVTVDAGESLLLGRRTGHWSRLGRRGAAHRTPGRRHRALGTVEVNELTLVGVVVSERSHLDGCKSELGVRRVSCVSCVCVVVVVVIVVVVVVREGSRREKGRKELRIYRVGPSEGISKTDSQASRRQCGKEKR